MAIVPDQSLPLKGQGRVRGGFRVFFPFFHRLCQHRRHPFPARIPHVKPNLTSHIYLPGPEYFSALHLFALMDISSTSERSENLFWTCNQ